MVLKSNNNSIQNPNLNILNKFNNIINKKQKHSINKKILKVIIMIIIALSNNGKLYQDKKNSG